MRTIVLILHDIRSTHNVGSLLRTAEGLGVTHVYFTGYSPYPLMTSELRLPHLAQKIHRQISKTALGAETLVDWSYEADITTLLHNLKADDFTLIALEQASGSIMLPAFRPSEKLAILLGREVEGIEPKLLALCDDIVEIPMAGKKESFNVVQAAAMVLYHCRFAA